MKHFYSLILSLILVTNAQAQDWLTKEQPAFLSDTLQLPADTTSVVPGFSAELDKRYGFRGLHFETPLAQVKGLKLITTQEGISIYEKITEDKVLDNAHLKKIQYCFYKGQLSNIFITASGANNAEEVTKVLMEAYGSPYAPGREEDEIGEDGQFYWHGNKATVLLSVPAYEEDFTVLLSSVPMKEKRERDKELRVKRAAEKL